MLLSEDHQAVQDAVRGYVQAEIAPHAAAWDKSHAFPAAQLQGLAAVDGEVALDGAGDDVVEPGFAAVSVGHAAQRFDKGDGAVQRVVGAARAQVLGAHTQLHGVAGVRGGCVHRAADVFAAAQFHHRRAA